MDFEKITKFYSSNKNGIIGAVIGIIIAVVILCLGLWKTLFIAFFAIAGYYGGTLLEQGKGLLKAIIDKILPPGTYR